MTESIEGPSAVDVSVEDVIRRPVEVVAAYACDPTNAPDWYANISAVEWKTPPPLNVGSRMAFVARFLGRELRYTYEVTEYTPTSLVMRTAEGPFPMETSYRFAATPEGHTRMTLRNRGTPSGFSRLLSPFMSLAMHRANTKDVRLLKLRLEG
ncbi:MAG: SRPBCC family protein [Acidimicrobiia bacterium]|nr:SRPBCC family protein [Acidimicrobiia bacterium]